MLFMVLCASSARADVYVFPRRPSKSNVHYAEFDWKYIDINVHKGRKLRLTYGQAGRLHQGALRPPAAGTAAWPSVSSAPRSRFHQGTPSGLTPLDVHPISGRSTAGKGGGVRLYFYEREREIARRAAASIEDSYQYLIKAFEYTPSTTFAYFLYASYIEFLQTQLFPLQEGVLGVTSPENLDVTLPYFGDARLFADVSTHELAHEFTIQKVASATARASLTGDALSAVPLWFIEGLAEFYAKRGIDAETEMLVRDILVNPTTAHDYVMGSFWEERFTSGLWTYKVGQARCAFLEESFGKGTIQKILEATPKLLMYEDDGGYKDFAQLVGKVTGTSPSAIAARFERWVKRLAFRRFMDARQDRANFTTVRTTNGIVQTLRAAPSGELVLYRSIEEDTGQSRLTLFDRRAPSDDVTVVTDDRPGAESLHPVAGQNFDVTDHELAFVAQVAGADVIYRQRFIESAEAEACEKDKKKVCHWDISIDLGERRGFSLVERGIDAVEALALVPNGKHIAFIGLNKHGQRDVYLLTPGKGDDFELAQLTNDIFAEREVSAAESSIVFSSDATGHGKYNLFRVGLEGGPIQRLTYEPRDEINPTVLRDGRVLFVAYDERGANLYSVDDSGIYRETDVATGLFNVSPGPDETVWALHHYAAERAPVRIARKRLLHEPFAHLTDAAGPTPPRERELDGAKPYNPLRLRNWELGSIFLMAGISSRGSIFGQVMAGANEKLRDHGLILSGAMYGDVELIAANLTYVNEQKRLIWGVGAFNDIRSRIDRSFFRSDDGLVFASWERYFGGEVLARYPFSRFAFLQGALSAGGAHYFLLDDTRDALAEATPDMPERKLVPLWSNNNGRMRFQTEASVAFGYNTIGLQRSTGPIRGSSLLLSSNFGTQPFESVVYDQVRLDAEHFFRIFGPVNLFIRTGIGATFGSQRAPQYYLSSFHTLRGVPFGDIDYLLGRQFVYATTELQFPIFEFSSFPLIDLEGVLAADAGAVADDVDELGRRRPFNALWDKRLLDLVFGVNFGFGPIVILAHFGQPIDIGPVRPPNRGKLTFNLSLNWRYQ
ncbi:MAG TPA: hypothetical protein VFN67_15865 [Polyangiales bacterium]|nr:hypothetical protein [Polyangiales bacterium]